jgi:hypothetical protein
MKAVPVPRARASAAGRNPKHQALQFNVGPTYDLSGTTVQVLVVVAKSEAEPWLAQFGNPE